MNQESPMASNRITTFERTTANQLCLERNRDKPNERDLQDAVVMVARWNDKREMMGLEIWL